MSKIISGEEANRIKKWDRPEFVSPAGSKNGMSLDLAEHGKQVVSEQELKRIYDEARKEGYSNGLLEGIEQGRKAAERERQVILNIIQYVSAPLKDFDEKLERELVNLSLLIAKQIIRRDSKLEPKQIIGVVRESVASLPPAHKKVTIYLHPADAEIVRELYHSGQTETSVDIQDDLAMSRGGCRVETEESIIDASLENRIATIAAKLFGGEREDD